METEGEKVAVPLRDLQNLDEFVTDDENLPTTTSYEQIVVEQNVERLFRSLGKKCIIDKNLPKLLRAEHSKFLRSSLVYLSNSYTVLDASRTWMCYWILHSLKLLEVEYSDKTDAVAKFLEKCIHPDGGFGGGPGQLGHLATTYAAVNSLCCIGTKYAYSVIKKANLENFFWSLRTPEGSFLMHRDGEVDIRGVYCALAVANLINIPTGKLFDGTAEWLISCQTYEGGFAGAPDLEAHGGYTFCGLAALCLLRKAHLCDVKSLLRWVANKQMKFEGGFQGRTNKLVDGCYSFWQAGVFPLIQNLINSSEKEVVFNSGALQEYILICCQHYDGGLLDKPGKGRDIYHTCYTLSGLSVAQHAYEGKSYILGSPSNELAKTSTLFNLSHCVVRKTLLYFNECLHLDELEDDDNST